MLIDQCKKAIAHTLFHAFQKLAGEGTVGEPDLYQFLEKPPAGKLGDYALPCFRFAKVLGMKPQEIPSKLVQYIDVDRSNGWLERAEPTGPFLNLFVKKSKLTDFVLEQVLTGQLFEQFTAQSEKTMVEFSQPNTHKSLHVGHVRNMALGDSLCRLFRYCGYQVTPVNYLGDEGTHIAKCLWYLRSENLTPPEANRGEWLGSMYAAANTKLKSGNAEEQEAWNGEISDILRAIESKAGDIYEQWKITRSWSLAMFEEAYKWFDINFDYDFFESDVSEESQKLVDEYLARGVFVESDGAIGIDLSEDNLGFMILRKRDGNTLYATKDLALARRKFQEFGVDRSIYVVGQEQTLHFKQVFKCLERMGFEKAENCFHLSYGLVRVPEGKMSSREGTVVSFQSLIANVFQELSLLLAKYESEWDEEQIADVRHKLAVGAIKYGMLGTDPVKDVVYNAADWVSFEGNSGPYLMYSYVRTQSILRKAASEGVVPSADLRLPDELEHPVEHELIRMLYDFNEMVSIALAQYKPSLLCHRLYELCKCYNRFYAQVSVLKAETPELKQARINLLAAFSQVLYKGLFLVGMTPPERM